MLRSEMSAAASRIVDAIEERDIPTILESVLRREGTVDRPQMLAAFAHLMQTTQSFGKYEKELIALLNLAPLMDVKFWATMLSSEERERPSEALELFHDVRFAVKHLPKILRMLAQDTDVFIEESKARDSEEARLDRLTVTIIEDRGASSPQRLILVLEAIQGLYDVASAVMGLSSSSLLVSSCDSGSDKSFDFLGLAKVVQCVKEVVLSLWDKIVYFREDKSDKHLELIANSLPILEKIGQLNAQGTIEPEKAEILRRQVIDSVTKFVKAGVTIPEIEGFTVFNPRQLMRADQKLLVASTLPEEKPAETDGSAIRDQGEELQEYLQQMRQQFLDKRKKGGGGAQVNNSPQAEGQEKVQEEDSLDEIE